MIEGKQIVCLAPSEWADNPVSNMHVMSRLATKNEVLYVETTGARLPKVRDLPRIVRRFRRWVSGPRTEKSHLSDASLTVHAPVALPFGLPSWRNAPSQWIFAAGLRRRLASAHFERPLVWTFTPRYAPLIDWLDPSLVIYHIVDDLSTYARGKEKQFEALELRMLKRADLVFVSGRDLFERKRGVNPATFHMPNGTDVSHMASSQDDSRALASEIAAMQRPVIGYVGTFASWTDYELIAKLARKHPTWQFVLVGYVHSNSDPAAVRLIAALPNVHMLGQQPFSRLPDFYRGFDACLIPFIVTDHVRWSNPVKIYEYLATGRPIISTSFPAACDFQHLISVAATHDEFIACVEAAVTAGRDVNADARRQEALKHSWDARVEAMSAVIERRLDPLADTRLAG